MVVDLTSSCKPGLCILPKQLFRDLASAELMMTDPTGLQTIPFFGW
jgi:hypothetical protein